MKKFQTYINVLVLLLTLVTINRITQFHRHCQKYLEDRKSDNYSILDRLKVQYPLLEKKPIVVVIPSYNNVSICEKNLESIFSQHYDNYRVIYIDDCSTDGTYERVKAYIQHRGKESQVTLIRNETRRLKMANLYSAIHMCADKEVVILLDGDDWVAHDDVLDRINRAYQNPDVWMTYGSAITHPAYKYISGAPYSDYNLLSNNIRSEGEFTLSTLRTFYAALFKQIKLKDFFYEGDFLPNSDDIGYMFPLIEMAPEHTLFIEDILYIINDNNPIRDVKVTKTLQEKIHKFLQQAPKYQPLSDSFFRTFQWDGGGISTPLDIIISSKDNAKALLENLDSYKKNLIHRGKIYLLYSASNSINESEYQIIVERHPDLISIKNVEGAVTELLCRKEGGLSSQIVLATDDFSLTEPMDLLRCVKDMHHTGAMHFLLTAVKAPLKGSFLYNNLHGFTLPSSLQEGELPGQGAMILSKEELLRVLVKKRSNETPFTAYLHAIPSNEIILFIK